MNIALEIGFNAGGPRGVDRYCHGLLGALERLDSENRYALFTYFYRDYERKLRLQPTPTRPNFRLCVRRWPEKLMSALEWDWGLPLIDTFFVRPGGFRIYHGLGGRLPKLRAAKTVLTVHDLIPEVFHRRAVLEGRSPEVFPSEVTRTAVARADRIMTDSESTLRDLLDFYPEVAGRARAVHLGIDTEYYKPVPPPEAAPVLMKYRLNDPFLLLLGPFEPRRNLERVLRAVAEVRRDGVGRGLRLAFVGSRNAYFEELEKLADSLGLRQDMTCLGYVPQEDLPRLYSAAAAFVHLSLYEGFGFPVLEALACGSPTLTSDNSSLPELAGDAALLADPHRPESIVPALRRLLEDAILRKKLSSLGPAQARKFTWEKTARETLNTYAELAAEPQRAAAP